MEVVCEVESGGEEGREFLPLRGCWEKCGAEEMALFFKGCGHGVEWAV